MFQRAIQGQALMDEPPAVHRGRRGEYAAHEGATTSKVVPPPRELWTLIDPFWRTTTSGWAGTLSSVHLAEEARLWFRSPVNSRLSFSSGELEFDHDSDADGGLASTKVRKPDTARPATVRECCGEIVRSSRGAPVADVLVRVNAHTGRAGRCTGITSRWRNTARPNQYGTSEFRLDQHPQGFTDIPFF